MEQFWKRRKRGVNWKLLLEIGKELEARSSRTEETNLAFIHPGTARAVLKREHIKALFSSLSWYEEDARTLLHQKLNLIICVLISIRWTEWSEFQSYFFMPGQGLKLPRYSDADLPLPARHFPEGGSEEFKRSFLAAQYQFLPVIIEENSHATYDALHRLPILKKEILIDASGARGIVEKVHVERKFLLYDNNAVNRTPEVMAYKRITARTQAGHHNFSAEQSTWHLLKQCLLPNENIMRSFASFIYGDEFIILSPWAKGRDLDLFLNTPGEILDDYATRSIRFTPNNLLTEALNLACALQFLHHELATSNGRTLRCAHLDLKPKNVLVVLLPEERATTAPVGRWKISDFDLFKVEDVVTNGQVVSIDGAHQVASVTPGQIARELPVRPPTRGPGAFQPPEVQAIGHAKISTQRDVWSFGCILAMVLAFAVNGAEGVKEQTLRRSGGGDDYFYRKIRYNSKANELDATPMNKRFDAELKPAFQRWLHQINEQADLRHNIWIRATSDLIISLLNVKVIYRPEISSAVEGLRAITDHTEKVAQDRLWTLDHGNELRTPRTVSIPGILNKQAPSEPQVVESRSSVPGMSTDTYSMLGQHSADSSPELSLAGSNLSLPYPGAGEVFTRLPAPHQCIGCTVDLFGHTAALWSANDLRVYDLRALEESRGAWSESHVSNAHDQGPIGKWLQNDKSSFIQVRLAGDWLAILESTSRTSFSVDLLLRPGTGSGFEQKSSFSYAEAPEDFALSHSGTMAIKFNDRIHLRMNDKSATIPLDTDSGVKEFVHMSFTATGTHFCLWERDKGKNRMSRQRQNFWSLWTIGTGTDMDFKLLCPTMRSRAPVSRRDVSPAGGRVFLASFVAHPRFIACDSDQNLWLISADTSAAHPLGHTYNARACFMLPNDDSFTLIRSSLAGHLEAESNAIDLVNGGPCLRSLHSEKLVGVLDVASEDMWLSSLGQFDDSLWLLILKPSGSISRHSLGKFEAPSVEQVEIPVPRMVERSFARMALSPSARSLPADHMAGIRAQASHIHEPGTPGHLGPSRKGEARSLSDRLELIQDTTFPAGIQDSTDDQGLDQALLGAHLTSHSDFRQFWQRAEPRMREKCFENSVHELISTFHEDLLYEAGLQAEKAIAKFGRIRQERLRMSTQLVLLVRPEEDNVLQDDHADIRVSARDKKLVRTWLATTTTLYARDVAEEHSDLDVVSAFGSDDEEEGLGEGSQPLHQDMHEYVHSTAAFQMLLWRFALLLLPLRLRHVLETISAQRIWITLEQNMSTVNLVKSWIEDLSQAKWDWWPLSPRMRMLREGEHRLIWHCTCGRKHWEEFEAEQYELVSQAYELSKSQPRQVSWCGTKRNSPGILQFLNGRTFLQPASSAAQKYTPPTVSSSSPNSANASGSVTRPAGRPVSGSSSPAGTLTSGSGSPTGSLRQNSQLLDYILFSAQGPQRTLAPGQLIVKPDATDGAVLKSLRTRYRYCRGWLRYYFSVWSVDNCHIVRFHRHSIERMSRECKDMPHELVYKYTPRKGEPEAQNPPISSQMFGILFHTCEKPCNWFVRLFHDCIAPPSGLNYLPRIPKRASAFDNDQSTPIWGLEAEFVRSAFRTIIYHCMIVALPMAFFIWWVVVHPNDLQNAAVPITISLGGLSLFWALQGTSNNGQL